MNWVFRLAGIDPSPCVHPLAQTGLQSNFEQRFSSRQYPDTQLEFVTLFIELLYNQNTTPSGVLPSELSERSFYELE